MQVIYNNNFKSIIKASILKEIKGYTPVTEANLKDNNFIHTKDTQLNQLFIEWDWINGTPHNILSLEKALNLALRHHSCKMDLIFKVITQALKKGVDYILTRRSPEARKFCNLVLDVREELRNAKLNIHFKKESNLLIGRYLFSHNIADLLKEFYQKRFPEKKVIINNAIKDYHLINRMKLKPEKTRTIINPVQSPITLKSFF